MKTGNILSAFDISSQGMAVQRMRLSATAKNIANVNTTKDADGGAYRREIVRVEAVPQSQFAIELTNTIGLDGSTDGHSSVANGMSDNAGSNVVRAEISKDSSPGRLVYDPAHPDANEEGYVTMPDINIVTEMVEMISAQRAFEANTNVIEAAKNIARDSIEI